MFVLARDGTAQAHPYYQVTWSLIPNLAMDLIVPGIGRHIGVEMANRLFYLLSQILIVTGAMALERAVKGRLQIAGFVALIFLYSMPFAFGFENFEFGLGCALWGFACAMRLVLGIEPALDDLDAVEIGADRIPQRGDQECRSRSIRCMAIPTLIIPLRVRSCDLVSCCPAFSAVLRA